MSRMFCLTCFYDLRGLAVSRCPECGRPFSAGNPKSFSPTPRPERLHKLLTQASALLAAAMASVEPADPVARAVAPLRRQVARLAVENWELKQQVAALTAVLLDRGLIDPADLEAALERAAEASNVEVVDDTPAEADGEPVAVELLELERAVQDRQG